MFEKKIILSFFRNEWKPKKYYEINYYNNKNKCFVLHSDPVQLPSRYFNDTHLVLLFYYELSNNINCSCKQGTFIFITKCFIDISTVLIIKQ